VWPLVADVGNHARWQIDVRAIDFTTPDTEGVGAAYDCHTRLGPIRMRIPMEVTEWRAGESIAVRYDGALSGAGRIALRRRRRRRTQVTWSAHIKLPWWLGGPPGALATAQLLRFVWRKNLANLAAEVTAAG
jgi:hypothetical protein